MPLLRQKEPTLKASSPCFEKEQTECQDFLGRDFDQRKTTASAQQIGLRKSQKDGSFIFFLSRI